jgi:hypothetical protein
MAQSIQDIKMKVLSKGADRNMSFADLLKLVRSFNLKERSGNHPHVFSGTSDAGPIFLNLQPDKNNKAKPYQVAQVRSAIETHGL